MKLNKLGLLVLLLPTGILHAQTDFRPGYVINLNGDTLYGAIDYRNDLSMSLVCKFKDKESKITEYNPNEIAAYRFIDSKYFVSREISHKIVFLEYLIKGKINMYYMRDESGDHYYLDKDGVKLTEIPYEEGIKYVGDRQVFYKTTKHIGLLTYYMKDAPGFQSRISSVGKPEHQDLIKLAKDYHNAVCDDEECIIYEKSVKLFKILPELTGGAIYFINVEDLNTKFYVHTGIIGHIWMPRANEKLYFRTGIIFSQLDYVGEKENFYKIPCQVEYIYPKGIFRPRFAYGINIFNPFYQSVSFNLGGNIKLFEKIFLSTTTDIEFNPVGVIVPGSMLSYSLQLGILMNLY